MTVYGIFRNDQIDAARPLVLCQLCDACKRFVAEIDVKQFAPFTNLYAGAASEVSWVKINTKLVMAIGFDVVFYNFVSDLGFIYRGTHACTYCKEGTTVVR